MSIDIRYLTNGKKDVVVVRNAGVEPVEFNYYNSPKDVPEHIRHYCPETPRFVEPDCARLFNVIDILYPNFPKCNHPEYIGKNCIAESCKYAVLDYETCPYFDKAYCKSISTNKGDTYAQN